MARATRMETWLEGLGEWSWPGVARPIVELVPAAWVPSVPTPLPALASAGGASAIALPAPRARSRPLARPLRLARLAVLLAVGAATFVISTGTLRHRAGALPLAAGAPVALGGSLADPFAAVAARLRTAGAAVRALPVDVLAPPPLAVPIATDRAGSTIARISFHSRALGWRDTYLVYLPPGYRRAGHRRYPVLYLLHGDAQPASSFLRLGLQPALDRLIRHHTIAPMIAVMLQANGLPDNWRDGSGPQYKTYVGEVRAVTDQTLRTIPARSARGIAGYSMGGFGAMNVALAHLGSYSVVESWEGFFDNLAPELAADRRLLARMPLHAFVWGGRQDAVASAKEDAPWAAALRAAGARARSAVWTGTHSFATIERHLTQMLIYAGRLLRG